ncbi:MAG: hypothetical protein M3Z02_01040 [Actinomycetota bacterium]|nr:hypothetical protein [Actinomycetota bacterium]
MSRLTKAYGAGPLHVLATVACFALAGYAVLKVVHAPQAIMIAVWFVGAIIGHDLILYPLYALADRSLAPLRRRQSPALPAVPWINHLRVPVVLSGLLFLVSFPLILGLNEDTYRSATGLGTSPYLGRWLLLTGVLFVGSALVYALRVGRAARAARAVRAG